MKAKANYGGLVGVVPASGLRLRQTVSIAGGESLLQRADQLYQDGNEEEARAAVREALQAAMRRLDAVHGTGGGARSHEQPGSAGACGGVAWEPA